MPDLLLIDGSEGEGGGQILRTPSPSPSSPGGRSASTTSAATAPSRASAASTSPPSSPPPRSPPPRSSATRSIRANVTFTPVERPPRHLPLRRRLRRLAMLVLQTVLPALIIADAPSTITLAGGTHNFGAPPFQFLSKAFLPLIAPMGPASTRRIDRAGFAPRGGGRAHVNIAPAAKLKPLEILTRGPVRRRRASPPSPPSRARSPSASLRSSPASATSAPTNCGSTSSRPTRAPATSSTSRPTPNT